MADEPGAWEVSPIPALPGDGAAVPPLPGPASVAVAGVTLAHPGGRTIAEPDFTLRPGERRALTGRSGAGKTTPLQALAGRITPQTGSLTAAGVRLEAGTADAWRARHCWACGDGSSRRRRRRGLPGLGQSSTSSAPRRWCGFWRSGGQRRALASGC